MAEKNKPSLIHPISPSIFTILSISLLNYPTSNIRKDTTSLVNISPLVTFKEPQFYTDAENYKIKQILPNSSSKIFCVKPNRSLNFMSFLILMHI